MPPDRNTATGTSATVCAAALSCTASWTRAIGPVPEGQRKHASRARERRGAIARDQPEQHFGIAGRDESLAAPLELVPQRLVVVDFAVEDEMMAAVRGRHRLRGGVGQVDDR